MTDDRPTLLLLDGHSLAYRAFYALPDTLRTQNGTLTNAVYGFTSMLVNLLRDRQPDGIAVAFDRGRDVSRTEAFPDYKANRSAPPDEFRPQVDLIKQVCEVFDLPVMTLPGVEADDVLATVATRAIDMGWDVFIVTGDRDAMQLPNEHLTVLYTLRGISEMAEMTPAAVADRYGILPGSYVDVAALRGDNSDNLPGVPGVGDKTAAKLVNAYSDIDGIYANIDDIGGKKVPAMLVEHEERVRLNQQVMRLRRDVDVEVDLEALRLTPWDAPAIRDLFATLEFRNLYDRFADEVLNEDLAEEQASGFQRVPTRLEAGDLAAWLDGLSAEPVAIVVDTSDRVPHLHLDAIGLSHPDADPVSLHVADAGAGDLDAFGRLLADPDRPLVTHDAKVLCHVASGLEVELAGVTLDTELAAYLLNPAQRSFTLDALALQFLSRTLEVAGSEGAPQAQLALGLEETDEWEQRALRAEAVRQLGEVLMAELDERDQRALLDEIELPLVEVLAGMEAVGMAVDRHVLGRHVGDHDGPGARTGTHDPRPGRTDVQRRVRQAVAGGALRGVGPAQDQADQDRLVDRRHPDGQDRRCPSDRGGGAGVARGHEVAVDLHRRAATAGGRRDRPSPHHVVPDHGRDRTTVVVEPEPAEHSGASRGRPRDSQGLRGGRRG